MQISDMVGATFDLYGVDGNCFRLGLSDGTVRTFEAVEDENDGYRSSLAELRDVTDRPTLVFSSAPVARATGKRAPEGRDGNDVVELVDEDGHSWLSVGTSDTDDYYPCFVFTWTPKAPATGGGLTMTTIAATDLSKDLDPRTLPVRFSHLKKISKSPADYLHGLTEDRDTRPMRVGYGVHAICLGGDFRVYDGERRGKDWQLFAAENTAFRILTKAEHDEAKRIADAVLASDLARPLLGGKTEAEIVWQHAGRACVSHVDSYRRRSRRLVELKVTNDSSPAKFCGEQRGTFFRPGQALSMAYHAQLAFYAEAIEVAEGWRPEEVYIVAVESQGAHNVTVCQLDAAAMAAGRELWLSWMGKLLACEEAGRWPGYAEEIVTLTAGGERLVLSYDDEAAA